MKSFLAMLMVLLVSGDEETISGSIEGRVLLPCPCLNRNMAVESRWQMEQPNRTKVLSLHGNIANYSDKYKNRAKTFQHEDKYDCSLLLSNVTADDQGTYKCSFHDGDMYMYSLVHLNVSANYNICQTPVTKLNGSLIVRECDVEGRYRDTEILWYQDQRLLTNSATTKISNTYAWKADGDHTFKSKIITELTGISEPICHVRAKGISANISHCYNHGKRIEVPSALPCYKRYFKLIPIALVIGVSLMLMYQWKHSRGLQRARRVETNRSLS